MIIDALWVAHGRLPPEMNQLLRVPLRQRYVLILGGGDSPDPVSIPRWNSTQETPRGSVYELIVEETERMMARKTYLHNSGSKAQQCHNQEGPHHLGAFRVYLPPAWLAPWSNNCQPKYEDSLKNPSQPPVLYISSIYLDHLTPKPRSDLRVNEIGSS